MFHNFYFHWISKCRWETLRIESDPEEALSFPHFGLAVDSTVDPGWISWQRLMQRTFIVSCWFFLISVSHQQSHTNVIVIPSRFYSWCLRFAIVVEALLIAGSRKSLVVAYLFSVKTLSLPSTLTQRHAFEAKNWNKEVITWMHRTTIKMFLNFPPQDTTQRTRTFQI